MGFPGMMPQYMFTGIAASVAVKPCLLDMETPHTMLPYGTRGCVEMQRFLLLKNELGQSGCHR
jgi:hypothetical protein